MNKILFTLLSIFVLSACSDKKDSNNTKPTPATQQIVNLAMPGDYAPMSTFTEKRDLTGFEWDLMNEIAKTQGFQLQKQIYMVPQWENQLFSKQSDMMSITFNVMPETRSKIKLSKPFFTAQFVVGVLDKGQNWQEHHLQGKKISVSKLYGEEAIDLAAKLTGSRNNVLVADTFHLSAANMYAGKADGVLAEDMVFAYYSNMGERAKTAVKVVNLPNEPKREIAFAVRAEDTALLNQINMGLEMARANGQYQAVAQKWILTPATGK